MNGLRIGSLFSGIGGLELGLEAAGVGHTVWQCEIDPWARQVLARHWPGVPCHDDIRTFQPAAGSADIVCGGFPCQDISQAGSQQGLEGKRSGLWREYARVIRLVRPRYVVVENVPPLLGLGMGTVLGDLAALGYDAEWNCIPAAAVGAPHLRDRVWLLAYANGGGHLHRPPGKLPADGRLPPLSLSLGRAVMRWPTPCASDGEKMPQWRGRRDNLTLEGAARRYPTPMASDWKRNGCRSETERDSPNLPAVVGGRLNPTWVEWLMGFPLGWTESAASETPLSLKSPPGLEVESS